MVIEMVKKESYYKMLKKHEKEILNLQDNCIHSEYNEIFKPVYDSHGGGQWYAFCKQCGKRLRAVTDSELLQYTYIQHTIQFHSTPNYIEGWK